MSRSRCAAVGAGQLTLAYLPYFGICRRRDLRPGKLGSAGISGIECRAVMQLISFKNTGLFKRGIWLSAAALITFAVAPSVLDGTLRQNPASSLFAPGLLGAFFVYFLWATQFHRLVDEVSDCGDRLKVRRGSTELAILFSDVDAVHVAAGGGIHRITVRLRAPTKLGGKIEFLPQASLWSNIAGIKRLASSLADRAREASTADR